MRTKAAFSSGSERASSSSTQSGSSLCILFLYVSAPNSVVDDQQIQHIDMYLGGIVYHGDGKTVFAEKQRKVRDERK